MQKSKKIDFRRHFWRRFCAESARWALEKHFLGNTQNWYDLFFFKYSF